MAGFRQVIRNDLNLPFMKYRYVCGLISSLLVLGSIYLWVSSGQSKYGIDFVGGSELVVRLDKPLAVEEIRKTANEIGGDGAIVQEFQGTSNEFSIRLSSGQSSDTGKRVREALEKKSSGSVQVVKEDFVGPVIGEQIRRDGVQALAFGLIGILIYIAIRFEWRFALGAVLAVFHDVIITAGIYLFSGKPISSSFLAAILTVIGYSVNDSIVVFDRVRENLTKQYKSSGKGSSRNDLLKLLDDSINQTLSRTMLTVLTTLFSILALWLIATGDVSDLAYALLIGVVVGTYSSVFIACYLVYAFERGK